MKQIRIGDVTIDAVIEREGPWRRPQDFFPTYDDAVFRHHLKSMEPEVFDVASGLMVITYQTFVVRTPHYTILVVPTTFYLAIMWGGWPFTKIFKNPVVAGLALLVASYVITFGIFRIFLNYSFVQSAPFYLQSAPQGMFNAVMALVFYVTALAVMFMMLCFDLWPLTTMPGVMAQPVLGLVWTVVILVGAAVAWLPIVAQFRSYDRRWLRGDLIAGITVAALIVPKNLGYAGIAGIPLQNGLYAAAAGATTV